MILSLPSLSTIRVRANIKRADVENLTTAAGRPITAARQKELETGPIRAEPWFDEALDLARILLLPGILPLMWGDDNASGDLTAFDLGHEMSDEVDLLLAGVRLPLSMACRIALRFGLSDPMQLEQVGLHQQIWATIERNERGAGPGECPWCRAPHGEEHLPTCLPSNIWRTRSTAPYFTGVAPSPLKPRMRGTGKLARGLQALRKAKGITQATLANDVGMHPNYLARIEQLKNNLTEAHAVNIARLLGCELKDLFGVETAD